jgi:Putative prokaryotic signal transducing protein
MPHPDLIVVQSYATESEAEMAKGVLESAGIDAMIQADTAGRMRNHLAWSGTGHRVLVREADEAAARELLLSSENQTLVLLKKATEIEAEILQETLLSAGIYATVRDDEIYYEILVSEADLLAARKAIQSPPETQP